MARRILFIFTSNDRLVNTSTKTGWYLPEAAHPYYGLTGKGIAVDFVSESGGRPPLDPQSIHIADNDSVSKRVRQVIQADIITAGWHFCRKFLEDDEVQRKLESDVDEQGHKLVAGANPASGTSLAAAITRLFSQE